MQRVFVCTWRRSSWGRAPHRRAVGSSLLAVASLPPRSLPSVVGGRTLAGAPLPLGAASVAAALALLTPASGRLSLLYAGYPRRLALVPRLGSPALRVLGVLARQGCRSLGRWRSYAPYTLRVPLPLCAPPRPLCSSASGCRSLRSLCACPRSSHRGGLSLPVGRSGGARSTPPAVSRRQ